MKKSSKKPLPSSKPSVALFEPKIPQNTGNIVRSCAAFGADLILIEPLGFRFSSRQLRRAGLDHFDKVTITRIASLDELFAMDRPIYLLSAHGEKPIEEIPYSQEAIYLFGSETDGLPTYVMEKRKEQCYTIPQNKEVRCLNLANSAAIVLYHSYRNC